MDGWMAGLGAALPPCTDALGQLLAEYAKRVFNSQLQQLKDIAGTLAMEAAEDSLQVAKLRSVLESVDHKRRKILQQMKSDATLLTLEVGGSPVRNPSTAAEDARLASLISLDGILEQVKDIMRQSSVNMVSRSKKKAMIASLDKLIERMPSLLAIDHPCAQRQITEARRFVELSQVSTCQVSPASKKESDITEPSPVVQHVDSLARSLGNPKPDGGSAYESMGDLPPSSSMGETTIVALVQHMSLWVIFPLIGGTWVSAIVSTSRHKWFRV